MLLLDAVLSAAPSASASATAIVVPAASVAAQAPAVSALSGAMPLLVALAAFLFYFGPAMLRAAIKPERGSPWDLRIAAFEAWTFDMDKRYRIREKSMAAALKAAGLPADPLPEAEVPPVVHAPPAAPPTEKDPDR